MTDADIVEIVPFLEELLTVLNNGYQIFETIIKNDVIFFI